MNTEVGDFDQDHMCRDIGKLRNWMREIDVVVKTDGQKVEHGRGHLLGYSDDAEGFRGWGREKGVLSR
jgi:hypothetical protein